MKVDNKDGRDIAYTTLIKMRKLKRYNRWIFEKIEKYIGNTIMEIGSGIGNITKYLVNKKKVIATDINQKYLLYLKNAFERCPNIIVRSYNLVNPPDASLMSEKVDTIICLNVLEHIKDDLAALKHLYEILAPQGRIVLLAPAMKQLYGTLDKHLEHYRRYDKDEICKELESVGFKIIHSEYFNFIGAFGWYFNSKILRSRILPSNQLRLINLVVNFLKLEKHFKLKMGLSLIAVGEK